MPSPFKVQERKPANERTQPLKSMLDEDQVRLNVAIPAQMHTALKIRAAKERKPINAIVRTLLQDYLDES